MAMATSSVWRKYIAGSAAGVVFICYGTDRADRQNTKYVVGLTVRGDLCEEHYACASM